MTQLEITFEIHGDSYSGLMQTAKRTIEAFVGEGAEFQSEFSVRASPSVTEGSGRPILWDATVDARIWDVKR